MNAEFYQWLLLCVTSGWASYEVTMFAAETYRRRQQRKK